MPTEANRPPRHDQRVIGNRIGENTADNEFSSSAVVANADGSLFERVEYIQSELASNLGDGLSAPASFNPVLGYRVTKTATLASAPDALFDVTGMCEITRMVGEVTSVVATSTSMSLNTSTNDDVIVASTQITTDAPGTLYLVSGDPDLGFNGGGTPTIDSAMQKVGTVAPFIVNDDQIEMNLNGAGTGLVAWTLYYWPLESGASVAAAA